MSQAAVGHRSAHRPQWTQKVFVFNHGPPGLRQRIRSVNRLIQVRGGRGKSVAQFGLIAVACDGEALHRTNIDAGIAFDAALSR
jgi:hypothetical protein